jgi:FtsZ-binding cell division protein ZapB
MITLEQVRQLEKRVHQAVSTISALKGENTLLKQKLSGYEKRIIELEARLTDLKEGQSEIERGILAALDQLDALEDQVFEEPESSENDERFGAAAPAAEGAPTTAGPSVGPTAVEPTGQDSLPAVEQAAAQQDTQTDDGQSTEELDIF